MKKTKLITAALALVIVIAGAYVLYNKLAPKADPQQGQNTASEEKYPAPDFTVFDGNGNKVRLSDFKGKPVILNFWATWCGPCQMEMPDLDAAYAKYGSSIQFLMIDLTDGARDTVESAKAFIEGKGYSFPVYFDINYDAVNTYGVSSIPTTYFIDADGNIAGGMIGAMSPETIQKGIDLILPRK